MPIPAACAFYVSLVRDVSGFPDFLIVGTQKCGTTSLFHYLGEHPKVYACPEKEPHFYSYMGEERPHWGTEGVDEYAALFKEAGPDQFCVEASTWYLYSSTAAQQIRRYAPNTKCIALLRQPVERAYSSWSFRVQQGWESLSFEEAIAAEETRIENGEPWDFHYLKAGLYAEQVRRFYDQLGRDQVRVFLFDDFKDDSDGVVKKALSFLDLNPIEESETKTVYKIRLSFRGARSSTTYRRLTPSVGLPVNFSQALYGRPSAVMSSAGTRSHDRHLIRPYDEG